MSPHDCVLPAMCHTPRMRTVMAYRGDGDESGRSAGMDNMLACEIRYREHRQWVEEADAEWWKRQQRAVRPWRLTAAKALIALAARLAPTGAPSATVRTTAPFAA
jgi:hypothetical protein